MADDTTKGTPARSPPVLCFLDLPPEVRNSIYELHFPKGPSAAQLLARRSGGYIQMSNRFALLQVCRQIYEEASSLLQKQQRFVVKQPQTLYQMMKVGEHGDGAIIVDYLVPESEIDIRYDLDNHFMSSDNIYLMHINRHMRHVFANYRYLRVTAAISVHDGFEALEEWSLSGHHRIPDMEDEGFIEYNRIKLRVLRTRCDSDANFEIDAVDLISAADTLSGLSDVRVVYHDAQGTSHGQDHALKNIKAGLLLFVHLLIRKSPNGTCPKLWMRGDLHVAFADLEHEDGSVERVINTHTTCSWERVFQYLDAGDIIPYYYDMEDLQPFRRELASVAKTLADTLRVSDR